MKKKIMICFVVISAMLLASCNDELNIRQSYDFSVTTMPFQSKIKKGKTVEIRCTLNRSGYYDGAKFYIGYFQTEGNGILKYENDFSLLPNDFYEFNNENFRLYYTSICDEKQVFDLYVRDNFGQQTQLSFSFSNDSQ